MKLFAAQILDQLFLINADTEEEVKAQVPSSRYLSITEIPEKKGLVATVELGCNFPREYFLDFWLCNETQ